MTEALPMSEPTIYEDTPNAISSQGLADGPEPCGSLAGKTIGTSGQAVVRASPLALPATGRHLPMTGISGLPGYALYASKCLQLLLESRLLARMGNVGPTSSRKTLKLRTMPSGRPFCRLLVSAPLTSGTDFILRPTPSAQTQEGGLRIDGGSRSRAKLRALNLMPTGTADAIATMAWLMGYPPEWLSASPTDSATPSFPS